MLCELKHISTDSFITLSMPGLISAGIIENTFLLYSSSCSRASFSESFCSLFATVIRSLNSQEDKKSYFLMKV
jgi:hypothetical protein